MKILHTTLVIAAATTALTSMTTTAQANTKNFRSGVYAGAEMGWLYEEHKYSERNNPGQPPLTGNFVRSYKDNKNNSSFLAGLFLGYRHFFNCYFVGFELSAFINSSETHSKKFIVPLTNTTSKHQLEGRYNIIPAFVFGRTWADRYSLYGKIGYDYGQYRYKMTEYSTTNVVRNKAHSDKDFGRLLLGAGVEYAFNCRWSARMEYNFSLASDKKKMNMYATRTVGLDSHVGSVKVASSALKVGVLAKF